MPGPIDVVVFDLGNVLIPWDRRFLVDKLIDDPDKREFFLTHILSMEVNAEVDRGRPLPEVCAELVELHPEYETPIRAFGDRWIETIDDAIADSVELLSQLRQAPVRLLALSNWGRDTFELARPRYPFLDWFEAMVISGQEGIVKPEPEIFRLLMHRHQVNPATALFIDDSAANIAAGQLMGFETHHFTEPALLQADLIARGLLP